MLYSGRTFIIRETYTQYVYHEEQQQQHALSGARVSTFNAGENLRMEIRDDEPSPRSFMSLMMPTLATVWSMYVAMFVSGGDGVQGADGAVGYDTAGPQCLACTLSAIATWPHIHTPVSRSRLCSLIVSQDHALGRWAQRRQTHFFIGDIHVV